MAKQTGPIQVQGTIENLTFYKMEGQYYVKAKSSLTANKFWQHKAFERSRKSCHRFAQGNKLASRLYHLIPKQHRTYTLFCFLKKKAIHLLKEGNNIQNAETILLDYLTDFGYVTANDKKAQTRKQYVMMSRNKKAALRRIKNRSRIIRVGTATCNLRPLSFAAQKDRATAFIQWAPTTENGLWVTSSVQGPIALPNDAVCDATGADSSVTVGYTVRL